MIETTTVDIALFYAERGWRVFPVKPRDKRPLVDHWDVEATVEENKILGWWEHFPDANVGIATGKASGIFVLDVDGQEGEQTLSRLIAQHGNLPVTPLAFTGKGRQFFFAYPEGIELRNTAKRLGAGLDTRGEGGYVVAAPSVHPSGKVYQWHKEYRPSVTPLAVVPDWLLKLLTDQQVDTSQQPAGDGVFKTGERNSALTRLAGSMRRKGFGFEAMLTALLAENKAKCVPPLPEMEVRRIAESVFRYAAVESPILENRDRVHAEWAFAKSIFAFSEYVKDFLWLSPEQFSDEKLRGYWRAVLAGVDVVEAATGAGILADLENFDCDVFKVEAYAKQVAHFAYMDQAKRLGYQLQKEAEIGDYGRVDYVVNQIVQKVTPQTGKTVISVADVADEVEAEVRERSNNPVDVWGIPYSPNGNNKGSWKKLSELTGGKQVGELVLLAGEPKVGKSWWAYQDALFTAIAGTPVFIWSGEMGRKQVMRRMYQLLGVNGRNMRTGKMAEEDWDWLSDAKALILNSPIFIADTPRLSLHDLKGLLHREKIEHGIEQFVIDYAYLLDAPGKDEIERTANVSREVKGICRELELAGLLIASVNKSGMDTTSESVAKSNVRGSGQQIHDADVIYLLTHFAKIANDNVAIRFNPNDYDKLVTLHFGAGREWDQMLPGGRLHFSRIGNTPAFQEETQE